MAITADSVVVELEARVGDYNRKVADAANKFEAAMNRQENSAKEAERIVTAAAAGKARAEVNAARTKLDAAKRTQQAAVAEVAAAQRTLEATNRTTRGKASSVLGARRAAQAQLDAARSTEQAATREIAAQRRAVLAAERAADAKARAAQRAANAADRAARQQEQAASREANSAGRGGGSAIGGRVGALAGGVLTVASARQYLAIADAAKTLNAQLSLATAESGNFAQAQADVSRIAKETRSGLAETAQLYATFQRNAEQLGITQAQSARATETITKSFQISGATAQEAAGGLRQFLQALQSGTLRGEEFNSIVENAPRLAKLLADQLSNGNVGALRALSQAGQITSEELTRALTDPNFTEKIDAEFKQLPVTFDQAMTLVSNSAIETFGAFDQGGQFSTALANFIIGGTDGFSDLSASAEQLGINIRAEFEGLSDAFEPLLAGAKSVFSQINLEAQTSGEYVRQFLQIVDDFRNTPATIARGIGSFTGLDRFEAGRRFIGADGPGGGNSNLAGNFAAGRAAAQQRLQGEARDRSIQARFGGNAFQRYLNEPDKYDMFGNRLKASTAPRAVASGGAGMGGGGGSRARGGANAERAAERLAEEARRNQERFNDDIRRADDRILSAQLSAANTIEERDALARRQIERDFESEKISIDRQVVEGRISQIDADQLVAKAKELQGLEFLALATQTRVEREREQEARAGALVDLRESELRLELQLAQTSAQRNDIDRQLIDLRFDELKAANDRVIAAQDSTEAEIELARLRNQQIENERGAAQAGRQLDARGSFQRYRENLDDADSLSEDIDNLKIQTLEAVTDELVNATKAALGLKGAFGEIVGELIRIGIQRRLIGPIADALFGKADGSAGGGIFSSIVSAVVGKPPGRASGGNVMAGQVYKINENGPELFQPSQSGKIYPTGSLGSARGGGGQNVTVMQSFVLDARYGITTPELLQRVNVIASQKAAQAGRTAYEASPARMAKQNTLGT